MLEKTKCRSDIQGLRALAVMAVVILHISLTWLPDGYLGVDIFFVISGYLIIGFICRDILANKFSLTGFYIKRIKRFFRRCLLPQAPLISSYCQMKLALTPKP
jgi:peptidoglycan/LPS O-acetylase OafA/YrhL